jgi:hypothetical protein
MIAYIKILQQVDLRLQTVRNGSQCAVEADAHHDLAELAFRYIAQLYFLYCYGLSSCPI